MARTQYPSTSKMIVPQSKIVTLSEQQKEDAMWEQLLRDHHSNCEKSKCNDKRINGLYACQFSSINGRMYNAYLRYRRRREAYKSKLCRNFHGSGFCITGKECPFVHNIWEAIDSEHGNNFLFQSEMSAAFKTSLNTSYMNKCAFYSDSSSFRMSEMSQSDVQDSKLSSLSARFQPSDVSGSRKINIIPVGSKFSKSFNPVDSGIGYSFGTLHSSKQTAKLPQYSSSGYMLYATGGERKSLLSRIRHLSVQPIQKEYPKVHHYDSAPVLDQQQSQWSSKLNSNLPPVFSALDMLSSSDQSGAAGHKFCGANSPPQLYSSGLFSRGSANYFGSANGAYNASFHNGTPLSYDCGHEPQLLKRQQNFSPSDDRNYELPAFFDGSNVYSQVPDGWSDNCRY